MLLSIMSANENDSCPLRKDCTFHFILKCPSGETQSLSMEYNTYTPTSALFEEVAKATGIPIG